MYTFWCIRKVIINVLVVSGEGTNCWLVGSTAINERNHVTTVVVFYGDLFPILWKWKTMHFILKHIEGRSRIISDGVRFDQITLLPLWVFIHDPDMTPMGWLGRKTSTQTNKQCRPRSEAAQRGIWSAGSTLFPIHPTILHTFPSSKTDLLKRSIR